MGYSPQLRTIIPNIRTKYAYEKECDKTHSYVYEYFTCSQQATPNARLTITGVYVALWRIAVQQKPHPSPHKLHYNYTAYRSATGSWCLVGISAWWSSTRFCINLCTWHTHTCTMNKMYWKQRQDILTKNACPGGPGGPRGPGYPGEPGSPYKLMEML